MDPIVIDYADPAERPERLQLQRCLGQRKEHKHDRPIDVLDFVKRVVVVPGEVRDERPAVMPATRKDKFGQIASPAVGKTTPMASV